MKIDLVIDKDAQTSGIQVSQMGFDTTKTAKLFHMLSNTLYSDKPSSIIRELSSNAHDSHVEAGKKDVPFDIIAPTFENPVLVIRDYGVGLTADEAVDTILNYLGSTKDESDDAIGGWGIGAKSPFAYSYTYEVIVYKNGQFAHFTCWKNESGIPNKAIIDSGDTNQPTGVLVRVPIQAQDVNQFINACRKYNEWSNYHYQLIENGVVIPKRKPIAEKDFGDYRVQVFPGGTGQKRLVYGGFSYPMDECVGNKYDYRSDWYRLSNKLRYGYDIAFVIDTPNAVSFNMNREVLEQTEKSIAFVSKIIKEFASIAEAREKAINDLPISQRGDLNTLVEVDDRIDSINARLSVEDKTFESIFINQGVNVQFSFKSSFKKIASTSVTDLKHIQFDLVPVKDQIAIAYGIRVRLTPFERRTFLNHVRDQQLGHLQFLYIKAKTEDEAKEIIKSRPEFAGFDISDILFVQVQQDKVERNTGGIRVCNKPVVYCRWRKKRIPWNEESLYVLLTEEEHNNGEVNKLSVKEKAMSVYKKTHFILPSARTIESIEDETNVMTLEEYKEEVTNWFRDVCDNYVTDQKTLAKFRNWLYRKQYDDTFRYVDGRYERFNKLYGQVCSMIDLHHEIKSIFVNNEEFLNILKTEGKGIQKLNALKNKANVLYSKCVKLQEICRFVDLGAVTLMKNKSKLAKELFDTVQKFGYQSL